MRGNEVTYQEAKAIVKEWGARMPRKGYSVIHVVSNLERHMNPGKPDCIERDLVDRYFLGTFLD